MTGLENRNKGHTLRDRCINYGGLKLQSRMEYELYVHFDYIVILEDMVLADPLTIKFA